ncbi:ATP-binding protein [Streptomyces sp. RKAG293]|uniref:ATP-binding protein n=1 Tax=Streptomyces sp. RKAG293 TaxID=2893403 RepID=UPI00203371DE|nr:ATP-binding protein [Streptomyces sp. RKAG293]MCM2416808.1 ATP-binding protein [Streptomyces sp. RKAG293]
MELPRAAAHDARPKQVSVNFDGASSCIAAARDAASAFLHGHAPPAHPTFHDDVLLVVSELVTNAVRHAPGPLTLRLALLCDRIEITVRDTDPRSPAPRTPDPTGGRGWPIIQSLACDVRVIPDHDGKTVHAELAW